MKVQGPIIAKTPREHGTSTKEVPTPPPATLNAGGARTKGNT